MARILWPPANPKALSRTRTPVRKDKAALKLLEDSIKENSALDTHGKKRLMMSILVGTRHGVHYSLKFSSDRDELRLAMMFMDRLKPHNLFDLAICARSYPVRKKAVEMIDDYELLENLMRSLHYKSLGHMAPEDLWLFEFTQEKLHETFALPNVFLAHVSSRFAL